MKKDINLLTIPIMMEDKCSFLAVVERFLLQYEAKYCIVSKIRIWFK